MISGLNMTRPRVVSGDLLNEAMQNLDRTSAIAVGVAEYDELPGLNGPSWDLEMVMEILVQNPDLALLDGDRVQALENPTIEAFRTAIAQYAQERSARGDILIVYFSGHGCVSPSGSFGFCLKNSMLDSYRSHVLPITIVPFDEVVGTLAIPDVHPVFIIDACFSSATSAHHAPIAPSNIEQSLRRSNAESYALLASSSEYSASVDTPDGGAFTQALYSILSNGLSDSSGRRYPIIALAQLAVPLQEELSRMGVPLSRCYVGRDFPLLPIAKNVAYSSKPESFAPYMKQIVLLLWQEGNPREASLSEFRDHIGPGAYGNHSKLSLPPWDLLEDAGSNRIRRLTSKGKRFAQGKIPIPKRIEQDPFSGKWKAAPGAQQIFIDDL
jgi:hypothetical protein